MSKLSNREIIDKNINFYLDLSNKTKKEICYDLGISYSTFTDWVLGNRYLHMDKIEMIAYYFGIDKSDLIEEKHSPTLR